jgi:hypothetical protein
MNGIGKLLVLALAAALIPPVAPKARAAMIPVSGWDVHNGTSTVGGTASAPTFAPADNVTLMAPFAPVTLASDGDSVKVSTVLTLTDRSTTGVNSLNTQLRLGLFNGPAGAVAANDSPNQGFIIEYSNVAAGGLIREQQSAVQTNPFTSPTNIGNGAQDAGADSIQGANPGSVTLQITLTRHAGTLDLAGVISGMDLVSGNPYVANYAATGYSSTVFPADGTFTFNRIGLFLGDNVNAASASLADSTVTAIPEPASGLLLAVASVGGMLGRRQMASAPRRRA